MRLQPIKWILIAGMVLLSTLPLRAQAITLTACGHHDYPPFNWQQNGQPYGAAFDISRQLFSQLGVELKAVYVGPWKRCLESVRHGAVDVVVAAYATEERKSYARFSSRALSDDIKSVFVWKGREFEFASWNDLKGKRTAIQIGVSYGQAFDEFLSQNVEVIQVADRLQYFRMLEAGRIDFIPTGHYIGRIHAARAGYLDKVVALSQPISRGSLHIGISNKSPHVDLLPQVDQQLELLHSQGLVEPLLQQQLERYFKQLQLK